jgi:hypothetical protein
MARAALQIGVRELADAAKVSPSTITRLEAGDDLRERTVDAVRATLEAMGVVFRDEDGMVCVKLDKAKAGADNA